MTTHGMPNNEVLVVYLVEPDGVCVAELETPADSDEDDGDEPFADRLSDVYVDAEPGEGRERMINRFKLAFLATIMDECLQGRAVPDVIQFQKKAEN